MAEIFHERFKRVYYINGISASVEDYLRLKKDSENPETNPIKALIICGSNYNIITY